jgi:hypothetical protein
MTIRNRGISLAAALLALGLGGGVAHAGGGKVDVCHRDGTTRYQVLNISASALAAHTRHGDRTPSHYWSDADGDGYGNATGAHDVCPQAGLVANNADCDDTRADVNPGAAEVHYNGIDDDCNAATPDNDLDNDGYNAPEDCDDSNAVVNPGMAETPYNGLDDDCAPATPDDDLDADGFGISDDCDDTSATTYPGAPEQCGDAIDQSCDGIVDEGCIADCPCFGAADLDDAYAAFLAGGGMDGGANACWSESITGGYEATGLYFISQSFEGLLYTQDNSFFYTYGYDWVYGNDYCQRAEFHQQFNYGTGTGDSSETNVYVPITAPQREGCEKAVLDWAAGNGLACTIVVN